MEQWIGIVLAVVAVTAFWLLVGWLFSRRPRTGAARPTAPAVQWTDNRAETEAALADRLRRHKQLTLRSLPADARRRYTDRWNEVQLAFVELPEGAVREAQALVEEVMRARGYPVEGALAERVDLVWVDHPEAAARFREGTKTGTLVDGAASTEEFRGALLAYRGLFIALLERDPDDAGRDDDDADQRDDDGGRDDDDATARIPEGGPPNVPDHRAKVFSSDVLTRVSARHEIEGPAA